MRIWRWFWCSVHSKFNLLIEIDGFTELFLLFSFFWHQHTTLSRDFWFTLRTLIMYYFTTRKMTTRNIWSKKKKIKKLLSNWSSISNQTVIQPNSLSVNLLEFAHSSKINWQRAVACVIVLLTIILLQTAVIEYMQIHSLHTFSKTYAIIIIACDLCAGVFWNSNLFHPPFCNLHSHSIDIIY